MKRRCSAVILGPVLLFLAGASFAETVDYFTDNGFANPVAVMQHPCAEFHKGKTYIAYQGPHEDPYVCVYDHAARKWSGPVRAGGNTMGKTPDPVDPGKPDNHGRPALIVDGKGYIHLVFGGHGGDYRLGKNMLGLPGKGRQTHVVSKQPEDISAWEMMDNIPPFGTYSQFVKMGDGEIYLFYRHGSHRSDWVYQKSTDNCATFAAPVPILKHKQQQADPNVYDAWYAWFEKGMGDTITASYVYHPCRIKGHTAERCNGYYMMMDCRDATWKNAAGETLAMPVTKECADEKTLVCSTQAEGVKSNHGTCRVDDEGNPHLFFRQHGKATYTRWLGSAWQALVTVPGSDGDMIVESPKVIRMLLSTGNGMCWWGTTDGGLSWAKKGCPISSADSSFVPTALALNGTPDGRMVVSENTPGQNHLYRKVFLLGDNGPMERPREEADNLGDLLENLEAAPPPQKPAKAHKRNRDKSGDSDDDEE